MALTLIKNATVVSMDPGLGDVQGDILVDGERIAEIRPGIVAPNAELVDGTGRIAMPGFVNAHIHTWEFQLRGIGSDWVGFRDYHNNMHKNLATRYRARRLHRQPARRAQPDPQRHHHHHGLVPHPARRRDGRRGARCA